MSDCLVVGGGVIGMMSARYLALAGASVTLLEQQQCAKESSWAGGGIISPLYPWKYDDLTNELSLASQKVYQKICAQIFEDTELDPQYLTSGLLMMDEFDTSNAKSWMKKYQINYDSHPQGALFSSVAQVRNPRLLTALKADIINKGVRIIEQTQVKELLLKNNHAIGVKTNQGDYLSDNIVVCSGAWSAQWLALKESIFPIKGQMIVLQTQADSIKHIVLNKGRYIIPRKDGNVLIGSTMQNVGFDKATDKQTAQSLHNFAKQHFPFLAKSSIKHHWSGLRPASQSGKIMLGKHHDFDNVYLNIGHFRNGLNTAPESARRITQAITHEN